MKNWRNRDEEAVASPPRRRSTSYTRQFRQVITRLTEGFPKHHFLAYCLVSKESSFGIFLNERLLVLDTSKGQLKYYSHIPPLPLDSYKQLGAPKQIIAFKNITNLDFTPQKVRIGHVVVKWAGNGHQNMWKLIMGSNKIARQFSQLIINAYKRGQIEQHSKQEQVSKQLITNSKLANDLQAINHKQDASVYSLQNNINSIQSNKISKFEFDNKDDISMSPNKDKDNPSYSEKVNIQINRSQKILETQPKINKKLNLDIINIKAVSNNQSPKLDLVTQWLNVKDQPERSSVYNKFLTKCINKIEQIMQNFITNHLMHQEENNRCIIRDAQLQIAYIPLIESADQNIIPEQLAFKIQEEQKMVKEWESFNFISRYHYVKDAMIVVPMCCMLTLKGFKFFCKSSIQRFYNKTRLLDTTVCQSQLSQLEQMCHIKICNQKQQLYLIESNNRKIIYFNKLDCLPQISNKLPISYHYIQYYLTEGVISNQKDIEEIYSHINNKLIPKIKSYVSEKLILSTQELMQYLKQFGLTFHYLPSFIDIRNHYSHIQMIILSEMVACTMEWELRRRMQIQLFKNRQFGFAVNQIKIALNLLFQEDKYFMRTIEGLITQYFGKSIDFSSNSLDKLIYPEKMLLSLLSKLGLDCKLSLQVSRKGWLWKQININDNLEMTPFVNSEILRFQCFSIHNKLFKKQLFGQINYEIKKETQLSEVIGKLNLSKDRNGYYSISSLYVLLPQELKMKVNYYLSHYIAPLDSEGTDLQTQIYLDESFLHYYTHTLQYLTSLNKIRWLIRMNYYDRAEYLIQKEISRATLWNQELILIQIYNFYAKLKLKKGQINKALEFSLKALQYSIFYYEIQKTILVELLIAEQAFQSATFHFNVHNFTKSLDLYSTTEQILTKNISVVDRVNLNPNFLQLFVNKCSIYLIFGQYKECLNQCLQGLKSCKYFTTVYDHQIVSLYQFKIYCILFRCYQIKNMRKQLIQIANICCLKFFEDKMINNKVVQEETVSQIVKMLWISIIKHLQFVSSTGEPIQPQLNKIKLVYLKKVRKELINLSNQLSNDYRYNKSQIVAYLGRKILGKEAIKTQCRLIIEIINCLSEVTLQSRGFKNDKIYEVGGLQNQWLMFQALTVLVGYDYLIGQIEGYLHIYDYQY